MSVFSGSSLFFFGEKVVILPTYRVLCSRNGNLKMNGGDGLGLQFSGFCVSYHMVCLSFHLKIHVVRLRSKHKELGL